MRQYENACALLSVRVITQTEIESNCILIQVPSWVTATEKVITI